MPTSTAWPAPTSPWTSSSSRARRSWGSSTGGPPREEYRRRLALHEAAAVAGDERDRRIALARLAIFAAAAVVAWLAFVAGRLHAGWLAVPLAAFLVLLVVHDRAIRATRRARRAAAWYARALERLDGAWAGHGVTGAPYLDAHHPYAADLDLFGRASLFELLCTARTRMGERALASWLLRAASPDVVRERQGAVGELAPRVDLREDLALLGEELRTGVDPEALSSWSQSPVVLSGRGHLVLAAALSAVTIALLVSWMTGILGPLPFLGGLAAQGLHALGLRHAVTTVESGAERAGRDLGLLSAVLERFEGERFTSPLLLRLRGRLDAGGDPPSVLVARLQRRVELFSSRQNQFFAPIAVLLRWGTHLAFSIERWRARHGALVPHWLEVVGELEALSALAAHAYEHPDDVVPEILDRPGAALEGRGLGHPLLAETASVRNDVTLAAEHGTARAQAWIVSGSNMSGKSTLLRTVGTNVVLALAGGRVRAASLSLTPLAIGATLRVQDSLQEGTSRFYAEITRLRQIVALTERERPVLFLLDEILHGTNSHDRRIGAEAIVRGLLARGAIGLVTTHDLALAQLAEGLGARVANVHFEDRLVNGSMVFDYRIKQGIVRTSNALELMRSVGLHV